MCTLCSLPPVTGKRLSSQEIPAGTDPSLLSGAVISPKLNLEMEEFRDLSGFCQSRKLSPLLCSANAVDELNTPVFGKSNSPVVFVESLLLSRFLDIKAHFDYDRQAVATGLLNAVTTSTEDPFDFQTDPEKLQAFSSPVNIDHNVLFAEGELAYKPATEAERSITMSAAASGGDYVNNNYIVIDTGEMNTNALIFSPNSEHGEAYYDSISPIIPKYENLSDDDDEENLITVNSFTDILLRPENISAINSNDNSISSASDVVQHNYYTVLPVASFETPDNSRSASEYSNQISPALSLAIDEKFHNPDELSTPDVIEAINSIELERDFNILSFVNDEVSCLVLLQISVPSPTFTNIILLEVVVVPQDTHFIRFCVIK